MRGIFRAALAAVLGGGLLMASDAPAFAQRAGGTADMSSPQRARPARVRPRIVIRPAARPYRHCVDEYLVERRATGPTVVPNMRCWWAYR
jgi:hypothetical protein